MATSDSPLVQAAAAFDQELATYVRLGEQLLDMPLTTLEQLERANQTLGEIVECEQRLSDAGRRLIQAVSDTRQKQEQLSQSVIALAPRLQARNEKLRELMTAMGQLATDVQRVNALVLQRVDGGDAQNDAGAPEPREVSAKVLALSERADQLAGTCREAEFEELAEQAHSLHERLEAIGTKLQNAAGN